MITLEGNRLVFRFPVVHEDAVCSIDFQRTLRIPDDGTDYPLPPGLGAFPLHHLDDHAKELPASWRRRGGVMMPMYQSEAMWLHFGGGRLWADYPFAVKIGTGKINAVSGEAWSSNLNRDPQDYVALPKQPWLDGYCVAEGTIRQFVATALGEGASVEEQLTGEAEWGGVQIAVYPMKAERYETLVKARQVACLREEVSFSLFSRSSPAGMGLAAGGRMKQQIYEDPYELSDYDQRRGCRCFVTILNSSDWRAVTGERPPMLPPTAKDYAKAGLPWFDYFDAEAKSLGGSPILDKIKSLAKFKSKTDAPDFTAPAPVSVESIVGLGPTPGTQVREADI